MKTRSVLGYKLRLEVTDSPCPSRSAGRPARCGTVGGVVFGRRLLAVPLGDEAGRGVGTEGLHRAGNDGLLLGDGFVAFLLGEGEDGFEFRKDGAAFQCGEVFAVIVEPRQPVVGVFLGRDRRLRGKCAGDMNPGCRVAKVYPDARGGTTARPRERGGNRG